MRTSGKIWSKICLKAIRDTLFPNIWSVIKGLTGELNFLLDVTSNRRRKFKILGLKTNPLLKFSLLVGHPDLPTRKSLRNVLGLLIVMIFKKVRRVFSFKAASL